MAQACHRRSRQGVEGAGAGPASAALRAVADNHEPRISAVLLERNLQLRTLAQGVSQSLLNAQRADLIGVSRERVNEALNSLQDKGLIRIE